MTFSATDEFEAVSLIEDEANAATAPSEPLARNDEQAAPLFGMPTEPLAAGELPAKWAPRRGRDGSRFLGGCAMPCQRGLPCRRAETDRHKRGGGRASGRARVGLINRAADLAISPVSDQMQWGVADHWSDPFETLLSHRGDCGDYAILK
jgi:predicted transglutaminase-like cysteine proteinase